MPNTPSFSLVYIIIVGPSDAALLLRRVEHVFFYSSDHALYPALHVYLVYERVERTKASTRIIHTFTSHRSCNYPACF